jgi:putative cardiolipin synthase
MPRCRSFYWVFVAATVLFLAGCSALQPVDLPDEYSLAPAQSPLWTQLTEERPGDWIYLLNTGDEALWWRLRLIDRATRSIDLQTFLWKEDRSGLKVLRHLYEAADRGVRVRIMLDDTFTANLDEDIWDIAHHPNIEFRIYNPYAHRSNSLVVRQFLNLGDFSRVDHRMHNKIMVADNHAAIVGGRNLADEYFGSHEEANFRDMEVLAVGPTMQPLSRQFDEYWNSDWSFPVEEVIEVSPTRTPEEFEAWVLETAERGLYEDEEGRLQAWAQVARLGVTGEVEVFADTPASENPAATEELPVQLAQELIRQIDKTDEEMILISAYLIPTPELEQAIERAEERGVRVRILTNSLRSNNHMAAHSAYRNHVDRLVDHGAEVHEVRALARDRGLYMDMPIEEKHLGLHSKVLLIDDDTSLIGSANLDPRSLRLNTEMVLLIRSREFNQWVRDVIALDFHQRNAWHLQRQEDGRLAWVADDVVLHEQPAESGLQRLEDWFLSIMPIENEM